MGNTCKHIRATRHNCRCIGQCLHPKGNDNTVSKISPALCSPNTATVTIAACGSYTWHGTTYTASTNTPTFDSLNAGGCDSLTTLHLTITTPVIPSVSISSSTNNVCQGTRVTLTATPTNGGTSPAYQWQVNGGNLAGQTSAVFKYVPANNQTVSCVLTANNSCQVAGGITTSNSIVELVRPTVTPIIGIVSTAVSTCTSSSVTFNVRDSNPGNSPTFQWLKNGVNIPGATRTTYAYNPLNGDVIQCIMYPNNACQTASVVPSNSITEVVNAYVTTSVSISPSTSNLNVLTGSSITFTATPTNGGPGPLYQWMKNGKQATANMGNTFTYTPANGDSIYCNMIANNQCQTAKIVKSNGVKISLVTTLGVVSSNGTLTTESAGLQANLYPNPSHSIASLRLQGVSTSTTITVRGIYDNTVAAFKASKDGEIKLPTQLASGLYIVSITDGITHKEIKWVKN